MEKISKEKTPIINIMSLAFFARHFELPIETLQWGIVKYTLENGEKGVDGAVLINGIYLYIDIGSCKIRPCVNCSCVQFELMPCKLSESEDNFILTGEDKIDYLINKKVMTGYYSTKVYSEETTKYLLGAFTPW